MTTERAPPTVATGGGTTSSPLRRPARPPRRRYVYAQPFLTSTFPITRLSGGAIPGADTTMGRAPT